MKAFALSSVLLLPLTLANPLLLRRGTYCGQWDSETAGDYTIYNNLWGKDQATSGEQCTTNGGLASDGSLSWSVKWSWVGGQGQVKSYPNVVVKSEKKKLDEVASIKSQWAWSYTGSDLIANVAYDLFTASTADGSPEYEVMIWLSALGGAGPISSTGSAIASGIKLANHSWKLFNGKNGQMNVFSFVADAGDVKHFCGDLMDFVDYLIDKQGMSESQILQTVGAGTEPFEGTNAVFKTDRYSARVV